MFIYGCVDAVCPNVLVQCVISLSLSLELKHSSHIHFVHSLIVMVTEARWTLLHRSDDDKCVQVRAMSSETNPGSISGIDYCEDEIPAWFNPSVVVSRVPSRPVRTASAEPQDLLISNGRQLFFGSLSLAISQHC